jgi:putative ABC transport system permease protein
VADSRRRVEFSATAAQAFRDLPRAEQEALAERIGFLEAAGLPPSIAASRDGAHLSVLPAGNQLLYVAERSDHIIVIIGLEPLRDTAPGTVRRLFRAALPPAALRRAFGWLPGLKPAVNSLGKLSGPGRSRRFVFEAVTDLLVDLKFALRTFRRSPGFVALTLLTLAIGIGGNTAIFSVVNNVFLNPLPLHDGERLVRLRDFSVAPNGELRKYNMSPLNFVAVRERSEAFEDVVAALWHSFAMTGSDSPERVAGIMVSPNWLSTLGIKPLLGQPFNPEQERLGAASGAILISHRMWQNQFGGDEQILGTTITLDSRVRTIVGVMPRGFNFPYGADVWVPTVFDRHDGRSHDLAVIARLKPGPTIEQAREDLTVIAQSLTETYPNTNTDLGLDVVPARDNFIEEQDRIVLVLMAAVVFLLLITCVNVTNVLLARLMSRSHEIGIRAALGAGRFRQLRQFVTETTLLFVLGGLGGVVLTFWLRDYLAVLVPNVLRDQLDLGTIEVGGEVLVFSLVLSVVAGLVFGTAAALRGSNPDLQALLKEGGRSTGSGGRRRVQRALVVSEISLALVLLVGAGLMIDQFRQLVGDDLGFEAENLLTTRIDLAGSGYDGAEQRTNLLRNIRVAAERVPGVSAAAVTTVNPICCGDWGARIEVEGLERPADGSSIIINHRYITPGLFETMGIPIIRGRAFADMDDTSSLPVVIIDSRMASHFWPGEDPIGKRVRMDRPGVDVPWLTVVGIAGEVRDAGDYQDTWYLPYYQQPTGRSADQLHIMIRMATGPSSVVPALQSAIWEVDGNLPLYETELMNELYTASLSQDRVGAVIVTLFAVFGLALAALGIYGLMSYVVNEQTREIGMRIALGADRGKVLRLVVKDAARLVVIGSIIGLAAAFGLNRVLSHLIADLGNAQPAVLVVVVALLCGVGLLATYVPARRAARLDPVEALRT